MKRFTLFISIALLSTMLTGCATFIPMSAGERRAIESRDLNASYDNAYRATLTVLQDRGYSITNSDYQGGVIRGSMRGEPSQYRAPGERPDKPNAIDIFDIISHDPRRTDSQDVTVTLEKYTDKITKMRVVIWKYFYDRDKRLVSSRESDAEVFQECYAAIENEIYKREQLEK